MSKSGIRLKKNKTLDMIWHEESTLVFNKDKVVIGRFENNELIPLDKQCVELCEQYKFKYDETLITVSEDEEGASDNEGEPSQEAVDDKEDISEEEAEPVDDKKEDISQEVKPVELPQISKGLSLIDILDEFREKVCSQYNDTVVNYNTLLTDQKNKICNLETYIAKLEKEKDALSEKLKAISKFLS